MLFLQLLVEVLDIEVEVLLPVELENLLQLLHRNALRAGAPFPPVEQAVIAVLFVAGSPPPHRPIGNPDDLGRLPPLRLPAMVFRITSCTFIIRSVSAAEICWLEISPTFQHRRCSKRTHHVLLEADRSHATNRPNSRN